MPTARKTRRLLVLGVLVGVGAVVFALWPRGPRLEWYTSPPVLIRHLGTVRIQVLVPRGWQVKEYNLGPVSALPIRLEPPIPGTWLPHWLKELLLQQPEEGSIWLVASEPTKINYATSLSMGTKLLGDRIVGQRASRRLQSGQRIEYWRDNRAAFEATYRQICESFRVIR